MFNYSHWNSFDVSNTTIVLIGLHGKLSCSDNLSDISKAKPKAKPMLKPAVMGPINSWQQETKQTWTQEHMFNLFLFGLVFDGFCLF